MDWVNHTNQVNSVPLVIFKNYDVPVKILNNPELNSRPLHYHSRVRS